MPTQGVVALCIHTYPAAQSSFSPTTSIEVHSMSSSSAANPTGSSTADGPRRYHIAYPDTMTRSCEERLEKEFSESLIQDLKKGQRVFEKYEKELYAGRNRPDEGTRGYTGKLYSEHARLSARLDDIDPRTCDPEVLPEGRARYVQTQFTEAEQQHYDTLNGQTVQRISRLNPYYRDLKEAERDKFLQKISRKLGGTDQLSEAEHDKYETDRFNNRSKGWAPAKSMLSEEGEADTIAGLSHPSSRSQSDSSVYFEKVIQIGKEAKAQGDLDKFRQFEEKRVDILNEIARVKRERG
jgi:hypothetical protein